MLKLRFTKSEALGNDYILIDVIRNSEYSSLLISAKSLSQRLSDRHFGIGGDGVIFILPSEDCDCEMRIFNADGSEAEMCGNGIRQVARYYWENINKKDTIRVLTKAGIREIEVISYNDMKFIVNMGKPSFGPNEVPFNSSIAGGESLINREFDFNFMKAKITAVSMGNPHCVIFVDDLSNIDISDVGPKIENHPLFPNRVNVELVRIINSREISMRVWERGSGETMACGTGACAASVATMISRLQNENKLTVHLLGGDLEVEWDKNKNEVYMVGGANLVFEGTMYLDI